MRIELRKGSGGPSALTCVRADGSRTWGRVHHFLPVHDLTHCAVESVLGFDQAFFGLLASGWGLGDFASHAALPTQARWAESIVGLLDLERAQPECYEPSQFAEMLAASLEGQRVEPFRPLTANELRLVRDLRDDLWRRWLEVPPGGTLSIPFPLVTPESGVSNARPA